MRDTVRESDDFRNKGFNDVLTTWCIEQNLAI